MALFVKFVGSANPLPLIQPHLVGDHCNELAVGGLSTQVMDGIPKIAVQGIHITSVPRYLDGMTDGALHTAGGGAVFLGDFWVQTLRYRVDVVRFVHRQQDGIPQELVAFDVGGDGIRVGQ